MAKTRVDPLVSTMRCYEKEIDPTLPLCEMKEKYYKTFPITFLDNGLVRIGNVIESPNFEELKELREYLKAAGYHTMTWRHNGKEESFRV